MSQVFLKVPFSVGGLDSNSKVVAKIPAKFLLDINGDPIVNPIAASAQAWNLYFDGTSVDGSIANPNNYIIVPETYSITKASEFAKSVSDLINTQDKSGITGTSYQLHYYRRIVARAIGAE